MPRPDPIELGPRSLLWRWAGDHRLGASGLSAGILQLMHPGLGAGVVDHSAFFTDPWDRIVRSIPEIIGVIYDEHPEVTGHRVRDYHLRIKGVDPQGRPYSALAPETFWWAHATFQYAVEAVVDRFDATRLDSLRREQLYREGIEWYRRYGVSMKPVPPTRSAWGERWDHYCTDVLEMTVAAERAVDMALNEKADQMPGFPEWSRILQRELLTPILRLTAIGGLPPVVRQRFGIPWGAVESAELKVLEGAIREFWRFLPVRHRFAPRAADGWRRESRARRGVNRESSAA